MRLPLLLFLLLPVHTEVVGLSAGRSELLMTIGVLSVLLLLRRPTGFRGLAALMLGVLAAYAKETAFILPVLVLAWGPPTPAEADSRSWWYRWLVFSLVMTLAWAYLMYFLSNHRDALREAEIPFDRDDI